MKPYEQRTARRTDAMTPDIDAKPQASMIAFLISLLCITWALVIGYPRPAPEPSYQHAEAPVVMPVKATAPRRSLALSGSLSVSSRQATNTISYCAHGCRRGCRFINGVYRATGTIINGQMSYRHESHDVVLWYMVNDDNPDVTVERWWLSDAAHVGITSSNPYYESDSGPESITGQYQPFGAPGPGPTVTRINRHTLGIRAD